MYRDVTISRAWQSINTLTGIPVGEAIEVQYKGGPYQHIIFIEGSKPSRDSISGNRLDYTNPMVHLLEGSEEYWFRVLAGHCDVHASKI